jgi:hypothetical protein
MVKLMNKIKTKPEIIALANDDVVRNLAIILHTALCRYNHTDGCGWEYENWTDKLFHSRPDYLQRAKAVVDLLVEHGTDKDDIDLDLITKLFRISSTSKGRWQNT